MNYIKHLTGFFDKVANDRMLNPTHVSLYMSLFQFWNYNRFKNPISISRDEIMRISKISSKATYHKCLKALHSQGYIKYEPSYNPFKGSHVFLFNFSDDLKPLPKNTSTNFKPVNEQVVDKSCISAETSPEQVIEQVVVPYINNTNNTNDVNNSNSVNLVEQAKKNEEQQFILKNPDVQEKEKGSVEKEKEEMPVQNLDEKSKTSSPAFADYSAERNNTSRQILNKAEPPNLEQLLEYFQQQNFPELEANKFFNYFKSIGWLVGGKTPMADWQAAANNWMLNAEKFSNTSIQLETQPSKAQQNLNASTNKNYAEPL